MFLSKIASKLGSHLNIRVRLTVMYFVIFGISMTIMGIFLFQVIEQTLQKEFDDTLYNYAVDVSESVILEPSGDFTFNPPQFDRAKSYPFGLGTSLVQIRTIAGQILTQSGNFGGWVIPFQEDSDRIKAGEDYIYRTVARPEGLPDAEAESYRIISFGLDNSPSPNLVLQVAVPLTFLETQLDRRKTFLEIGIPAILILATLVGFFMSTSALAPVNQIIQSVQQIGPLDVSKRVPVPIAKDEIQSLSITMNEMLERLEKAFRSQERFVADASHQLLTPISICIGEIEQSLKALKTESRDQIEISLRSSLEELEHLTQLVKDLLLLARVDAGVGALSFAVINFPEILMEAAERVEKISRKKQVRLKLNFSLNNPEDIFIKGDEDLLRNLIFNLLENAIKYSPVGSVVSAEVLHRENKVVVEIKDEGIGLPTAHPERIFDRFARGSDTKGQPGYGLGLAIAKKIADIHQATLFANNRSDGPGAVFCLEIKLENPTNDPIQTVSLS